MLRDSGWFPQRNVSAALVLPLDFAPFPAALDVLSEFGNLRIGRRGPGIEFARTPVVLDPMMAVGESDRFVEFAAPLGVSLYPLGETDDGHGFITIDERGRVFLIFDDLYFVGHTFDRALDNLLRGAVRPRIVDEHGQW